MNETAFYAPRRQFRRALSVEWSLFGADLLYGVPCVAVGFFVFRQLGHSQVYDVTWPFGFAATLMAYLTWRACAPDVNRKTAPLFFNRPQDRAIALDARLILLFFAAVWFNGLVLVGGWMKLGGAGITACYRLNPEFCGLPFLFASAMAWHLYRTNDKAHWARLAALVVAFGGWFYWKADALFSNSGNPSNNFWPEREMPLGQQFVLFGVLMAVSALLTASARAAWRDREIGGIR